jgi:hypothetical protein
MGRPEGRPGRLRLTTGLLRSLERRRGPWGLERLKRLSGEGFSGWLSEIPATFRPAEFRSGFGSELFACDNSHLLGVVELGAEARKFSEGDTQPRRGCLRYTPA